MTNPIVRLSLGRPRVKRGDLFPIQSKTVIYRLDQLVSLAALNHARDLAPAVEMDPPIESADDEKTKRA